MATARSIATKKENHLTIPQLDKAIEVIKSNLYDGSGNVKSEVDEATATRFENLILRYTKAKNKIHRYYDKTMQKHPEVVRGKLKLLTVIDTMKDPSKAAKYNVNNIDKDHASFVADHKGLIVGTFGTAGAILGANAVTHMISGAIMGGEGIGLGTALSKAFTFMAKKGALQWAIPAAALGAVAIYAGKINPQIRQARQRRLQREELKTKLNAEELKAEDPTLKNVSFDGKKINLNLSDEEINRFVENPNLLQELENKIQTQGASPIEKAACQVLRTKVYDRKLAIDKASREQEAIADKKKQAIEIEETIDKICGEYTVAETAKDTATMTAKRKELISQKNADGKNYFQSLITKQAYDSYKNSPNGQKPDGTAKDPKTIMAELVNQQINQRLQQYKISTKAAQQTTNP